MKNPIIAGLLNILIPGLGCLYLRRWFYALAYFVWVPLAWVASLGLSSTFAYITVAILNMIVDIQIDNIPYVAVYILLRIGTAWLILKEVFFTPYHLASEHNQKISGKSLLAM